MQFVGIDTGSNKSGHPGQSSMRILSLCNQHYRAVRLSKLLEVTLPAPFAEARTIFDFDNFKKIVFSHFEDFETP
jgi:hypothetical protein